MGEIVAFGERVYRKRSQERILRFRKAIVMGTYPLPTSEELAEAIVKRWEWLGVEV